MVYVQWVLTATKIAEFQMFLMCFYCEGVTFKEFDLTFKEFEVTFTRFTRFEVTFSVFKEWFKSFKSLFYLFVHLGLGWVNRW